MKFPSWQSTCSSSTCTSTVSQSTKPITMSPPPMNRRKLLLSDTSIFSDSQMSSSSISQDSNLTNSSLESNLSILTLPSVPSLQKLSLDSLNLSVSGVCIVTLNPRPAAHVNCLAVNQNLLYAVSGNEINVFDLFSFSILDTFNVHDPSSGFIKSIAFLDEKVFTAHQDCKIRVWMINRPDNQHKHLATLPTLEDRVKCFIFPSNHIKVRRNRKKLWVEHFDAVSGLAAAHDLMSSVSWDKYLKIWIAPNFRCGASVKAHDDAINAVVISPDGTIYTGSADTRIKVWGRPFEERKLVLIATLEKHKSAVNTLALNSDGSVLFSGACDRSILVWEREDSANHMVVTGALRGHSKAILCLINVSELLISGSADRTVRIWKRGLQGKFCCLTVLDGHVKPVRSLVAVSVPSPENEESYGEVKVISGSFDGEIKVWKVMLSSIITR